MLLRFRVLTVTALRGHAWASLFGVAALLSTSVPAARAQNALDGYAPSPNGVVSAVVVQPDGKALIGGTFTQVNGRACRRVCRLRADGSVDPTFADPDVNGVVYALAVQPDGKLLIGGNFTTVGGEERRRVARLDANGSLDASFGNANITGSGLDSFDSVLALAVQPDGKIVIGGSFYQVGGLDRRSLARLNANGSLDTSFAEAGVDYDVQALAVQADGKLLVGGRFGTVGGQARHGAARLNTDGSLDTTFIDPAINAGVVALAVQPDGKLLVGGYFTEVGAQMRTGLARLDPDGNLDTTFADSALDDSVLALAVQPDGKLYVGGRFDHVGALPRGNIARLNADGSLDTGFADLQVSSNVQSLALQPDGKLLLGGIFDMAGGQQRTSLARVSANGRLDADFAGSGANDYVFALAAQADDKLLVGGSFTSIGGSARGGVARLNHDGSIDAAFVAPQMLEGDVFSVNSRPNGTVLVGGSFTKVREELLSGTAFTYPLRGLALLDQTTGKVKTSFNPKVEGTVYAVDLMPDGGMLVGGDFTTVDGMTYRRAVRLKTDGSIDASFADPRLNDAVLSLARQADGKVLLGGAFTSVLTTTTPPHALSRKGVARFKADGSLDSSFHDPGITGTGSDIYRSVMALALQADGKVLVGGAFDTVGGQPRKYLARLNTDGSLDMSFPDLHLDGMVTSLAVQADGKVLIGGEFTHASTPTYVASYNGIARLRTNGYPDTTAFADPEADGAVYALALRQDGKLLAGGGFTTIGGQARNRVARLSLRDAALQSLGVAGNTVLWYRGGSAPELSAPPVLAVSNLLLVDGTMTRMAGGWRYDGLGLPVGQFSSLRVTGSTVGGAHNASHGPVESVVRAWGDDDGIFADGFEPRHP